MKKGLPYSTTTRRKPMLAGGKRKKGCRRPGDRQHQTETLINFSDEKRPNFSGHQVFPWS